MRIKILKKLKEDQIQAEQAVDGYSINDDNLKGSTFKGVMSPGHKKDKKFGLNSTISSNLNEKSQPQSYLNVYLTAQFYTGILGEHDVEKKKFDIEAEADKKEKELDEQDKK